ncbi:SDR family oxidoreductase [Brevibacillus reuszeri]|uniref:Short-chain dehydrogenase n=1 Tax=Brevibacillus reuszeri TaxID=54915 RepID=A0A0K9YQ83_9BACL|nr:SDR family oxidoreductase [Brevibacillus reuszeri]KNB70878.1 hypothetical protein ADS79_18725 [Brevibacillus reuszeri]MED1857276.1 SDR family oxidoreductase [Brevibacillus reuszeri]
MNKKGSNEERIGLDCSLSEKVIVIIGGSSGIGFATAQAAYKKGANVVISGRSATRLQEAKKAIGEHLQTFVVHMTDESSIQNMFAQLKQVDHLFVTAANVVLGPILETECDELKSTMESRFWGSYYAAKYAAKKMKENGSITFMSGTSTWKPTVGGAVAAASGAAVEALCRSLAVELSPIRVNTISAGAVDTNLLNSIFGEKREEIVKHLRNTLPVRCIGEPEDIADAALYLMQNRYTTGTVLSVDGGSLLT